MFVRKSVMQQQQQQSPVKAVQQQQHAYVIQQMPSTSSRPVTTSMMTTTSSDGGVTRRNVRLVELVQQPGGKGQLVALGGGQLVRATATTTGSAAVQVVHRPMLTAVRNAVTTNLTIPGATVTGAKAFPGGKQ
jgi:hypothetical protein